MSAGFVNAQPGVPKNIHCRFHQALFSNQAQTNVFTIREIAISGNKKTKESVILRELPFKSGEIYNLSDLVKNLK